MRLLSTSTFQLSEKFTKDIPEYVILSHRWEEREVEYQDIQDIEVAKVRKGFKKIEKACEMAKKNGFKYIWIDTCCINKDSSTELSEELNSMYRYYQKATVCYAYLCDVESNEDIRSNNESLQKFKSSGWFQRGWTLQELIAPSQLIFFDKKWQKIGTKSSLWDVISDVTRISVDVLLGRKDPGSISIAQRMHWASRRQTTREEDIAYCLMGIFRVNMPPLYGEGRVRAFIRLQEEIMKYNDDPTIFAWEAEVDSPDSRGLLAWSPSEFTLPEVQAIERSSSIHVMTNRGIQITLSLQPPLSSVLKSAFVHGLGITFLGVYSGVGITKIMIRPLSGNIATLQLAALSGVLCIYMLDFSLTLATGGGNWSLSSNALDNFTLWIIYAGLMFSIPPFAIVALVLNFISRNWVSIGNQNSYSLTRFMPLEGIVRARLPCRDGESGPLEIFVKKQSSGFVRVKPHKLSRIDTKFKFLQNFLYRRYKIYVTEKVLTDTIGIENSAQCRYRCQIVLSPILCLAQTYPEQYLAEMTCSANIFDFRIERLAIMLQSRAPEGPVNQEFAVIFGIDVDKQCGNASNCVWVDIITELAGERLKDIHDSYSKPYDRADIRARALNEFYKSFGAGAISVIVQHVRSLPSNLSSLPLSPDVISGDDSSFPSTKDFVVYIDYIPGSICIPPTPPPRLFGLRVLVEGMDSLLEVYTFPKVLLSAGDRRSGYLAFNSDKTSGQFNFRRRGEKDLVFGILFVIRDHRLSADVYNSISGPNLGVKRNKFGVHTSTNGYQITIQFREPEAHGAGPGVTDVATITIKRHSPRWSIFRGRRSVRNYEDPIALT